MASGVATPPGNTSFLPTESRKGRKEPLWRKDVLMDPLEFRLNVRLVEGGAAPATGSEDCTSDNCGDGNTGSDACTTNG